MALITASACGLGVVGTAEVSATDAGTRDGPGPRPDAPSTPDEGAPEASVDCSLGDGGKGGRICGDSCRDLGTDRSNCGACGVQCSPSQACEGKCVDVASALVGFRVEVPCESNDSPYCNVSSAVLTKTATLTGTTDTTYVLTLRFRGVVEQNTYASTTAGNAIGENSSLFAVGGSTVISLWNNYSLSVGTPAETYRLNKGSLGNQFVDRIDYTARIRAAAGTTLTLVSDPNGPQIVRNRNSTDASPVVVNGVPPAPAAFDGQFVQIDVVAVTPE